VLTPHWIENLSMSFDWYSITMHQAISSFSQSQIFDQCANKHVASFCSVVFFGSGLPGGSTVLRWRKRRMEMAPRPVCQARWAPSAPTAKERSTSTFWGRFNSNRETVSGLDFQVDYLHDLWDGSLSWHILGNYTDEKTRTSLGVTSDGAGALSGDGANPLAGFTTPKFRGTISSTYTEGPFSLTAQARVWGSAGSSIPG